MHWGSKEIGSYRQRVGGFDSRHLHQGYLCVATWRNAKASKPAIVPIPRKSHGNRKKKLRYPYGKHP